MDDAPEFAHFEMKGARFNAKGLPAAAAGEITAYGDAVYEVARELWLAANLGRQRVPNGFPKAFDLRMTEVKRGSVRPHLVLNKPEDVDEDDYNQWLHHFETARDYVTEAIDVVSSAGRLPIKFPPMAARHLKPLGRSLKEGESIRLGRPRFGGRKAELNNDFPGLMAKIESVLGPDVPETVAAEGLVIEYDSAARSFEIRLTSDDAIVTCHLGPYDHEWASVAKESLSTDGLHGPDVKVTGKAIRDDAGSFRDLGSVSEIAVVRPLALTAAVKALIDIRALQDGWAGEGSMAPVGEVLDRADELLPVIAELDVAVSVGPTSDGSIIFEWRRGDVEFTAEIEPDDHLFLCADHTDTDRLRETEQVFDRERLLTFMRDGVIVDDDE